ncbi:hypothetical protein [Halalkalicoccus sp. NIPERK01]|uniref:hypothetical protein n=1 Tax=Halalkalicoccus sp. NIPERK01 TaxID=3053469 RepID=UPI00256EC4DF|nr:hypothetical protein [Halalkalicoccus sp. NIPERK01]MDL5363905.1 hypothetical protein [Halalkalicoccus sp. NIPERK01]
MTTSRRNLLRTVGAAGAATITATSGCLDLLLGGSSGGGIGSLSEAAGDVPTAINPEDYTQYFDEIVNAVDVGADPSGETPIDGVLNSYARPGTMLVFPEGVYTIASPFRHTGRGNVGIVGQNATLRHATVESITGHTITGGGFRGSSIMFAIGRVSSPHTGTLVLGGFTVDDREENHGMQLLRLYSTGLADIRNIRFVGQQDLGTRGPFRALTRSKDALAVFANIDMRYGGRHFAHTINDRGGGRRASSWSTSGFTIGSDMSGTMLLENVICGAFPDNGLYLKGGLPGNDAGRKILRNCVAANSNVASIRVNSGDDWVPHPLIDGDDGTPADGYKRTVVENCQVIVDRAPDPVVYSNQRGIRLDDGDPILRDTSVEIHEANGHGINVQAGTNGATIERCRVDLHEPEIGIRVTGANAELLENSVNLHGFTGGTVLSGIEAGRGVAVNRISQTSS